MSIFLYCRLFLNRIAVAFIAIGSFSVAHAAPDACALFTVAEPSTALGSRVYVGMPSVSGGDGGQCVYAWGALNQLAIEVWKYPSPALAQKRFSDDLGDARSGENPSQKTTVESGVGNGAFSTTGTVGTMKTVAWSATGSPSRAHADGTHPMKLVWGT
jgi:hypothetical protein